MPASLGRLNSARSARWQKSGRGQLPVSGYVTAWQPKAWLAAPTAGKPGLKWLWRNSEHGSRY